MSQTIPPLSEKVLEAVEALAKKDAVAAGLKLAETQADFALEEQIALCEIPAPTFQESVRAAEIAKRMKEYGLTDVTIDEIGNVVGRLKGTGEGPTLALGAHMDTVFPAGTDVTVKREGNRYFAPGIGDNCSGLRALLQTLRCFVQSKVSFKGELIFVGTVGEEGNGDIRGSKWFNSHNHVDGFIAIDNTEVGRILHAAVGSHRWRLSIDGQGGHSFSAFGVTPSAIHAVCRAGAKVADIKTPADPKTTYTIGTIKGGTSVNTIAPHCEVDIDIRSLDNDELLKLEKQILDCFEAGVAEENACWPVKEAVKLLKLTKTQIGDRPAGRRPHDCPVLQTARSALQTLGFPLTNYGFSSTDANYPVSLGIPATCLSAGGVQVNCHTVKEYYDNIDPQKGPQLIFLTAAALVGAEGTEPLLKVRA